MAIQQQELENKLHVFNSNSMEVLARIVARIITARPLSNPFEAEQVVIANQGMANYLTLQVATENQICANLKYLRLWELIWGTLRQVFPRAGTVNRFSHEHLTWSLFSLKEQWGDPKLVASEPYLKVLSDYIADDEDDTMAFELCSRIADTFDQYQMYRHDWIEQWNSFRAEDFAQYTRAPQAEGRIKAFVKKTATQGERYDPFLAKILEDNLWQLRLWSMLRANLDEETFEEGEDLRFAAEDRAACVYKLCEQLIDREVTIKGLPERIFVFGLSVMSPLELLFLQTLAKRVEVYYLLLNPCVDYWGDLSSAWRGQFALFKEFCRQYSRKRVLKENLQGKSELSLAEPQQVLSPFEPQESDYDEDSLERVEGHPLLLALGREEMELLSRLLSYEEGADFLEAFVPPECDSMLHEVQRSLLYAFRESEQQRHKPLIDAKDDSLLVHSCHTIRRQLEVLKDALLSRFAKAKGQLRLRDCVVMVPDIEEYTPYIHAVFGGLEPTDPRYLPYAIADRTEANESIVVQAVLQLLSISEQRITASLVLELLTVPAIAEKFSFSPEDLQVIAQWCHEAKLYWGLDDKEVEQQLSASEKVSLPWTFEQALERMLKGYMFGRVEGRADLYSEIEGDDAELLGRFAAFIHKLIALRELFSPSFNEQVEGLAREWPLHEAVSWMQIIEKQVIAEFFLQSEETETELRELRSVVENMQQAIYNLKLKPQITLPVFTALLKRQLGTAALRQPYLGDFINFCSLVPMRAVPFKHVFILGLNEGDFPRQDKSPAFNLMALSKLRRKGDRSRAADDRLLFLEALLSAEESLELFYIGVNPENQQSCVPSVVLSELLDFCTDYFSLEGAESTPEQILARLIKQESMTAYHQSNYLPSYEQHQQSFDAEHFIHQNYLEPAEKPRLGDLLDYSSLFTPQLEYGFNCEELTDTLIYPCKHFLWDTLQIKLDLENSQTLCDDEPFVLNNLEQGSLLQNLWTEALKPQGESQLKQVLSDYAKAGRLPYGQLGELCAEQLSETLARMRSAVGKYLPAEGPELLPYQEKLEYTLNARSYSFVFHGEIKSPYLYAQTYTDNLAQTKLRLRLFCASLALYFAGAAEPLAYAVLRDGRLLQANCRAHGRLSPEMQLQQCCHWYLRAHLGPLPFCHLFFQNNAKKNVQEMADDEVRTALTEQIEKDAELYYVFADKKLEDEEFVELSKQALLFYQEVVTPCIEEIKE